MNKFPFGVLKWTPVEDEDKTAEKRSIDMSFFIESPMDATYICKLNGKKYTREQILDFDIGEANRVWVMSGYAKMVMSGYSLGAETIGIKET